MLQDGVAHINLSHSDNESSTKERRCHRMFNKVPAADTRPPDGIATLQLQTVRFSMDILESKQRPQLKRSKTLPVESHAKSWQTGYEIHQNKGSDLSLDEMVATDNNLNSKSAVTKSSLATSLTNRKRKILDTQIPIDTILSPVLSTAYVTRTRKHPATSSNMQSYIQNTSAKNELTEIQLMVEGAMRLSIYGVNKSSDGLKLKANTFRAGLAELAPALWRPGYLVVGKAP